MKSLTHGLFPLLICFFVLQTTAQVPVTSGGAGAPAGSGLNGANNKGLPATGLGCGGGGGSWWGGTGGAGKFGGGGGGAGGYFYQGSMNWAGGEGGQGAIVVAWYNNATMSSAQVLISGTTVTAPAGTTSAKVWAIGAGGGAGGATANDVSAGGGGGAGGTAYVTKAILQGETFSYSIGQGGKAGHGAADGNAGGNTTATIAGTTITGNGGAGGFYNNTANASGGVYSGGDGGSNGGYGRGSTGDDGGGGGGGIGGANGTHNGNDGGTGANATDISGLFAACAIATLNSAAPYITGFTPSTGLSGTIITITGAGFTGASAVRIGGVAVSSFTINSDTEITATVAAGSVSGSVSVTCTNVTISQPLYLFIAPPVPAVSSFTSANAQTGQTVTINGSNLLGISTVSFGGVNASSFSIVSDFQLTAVVGAGSSGSVSAGSSGGTGSLAGFTFTNTTQANSINFTSVQTWSMTINWTNGNANKRIVFVKEGAGTISNPVNNTTYTASSDWSAKGTQLDASGYYCVYNGTGSSVTLTNLTAIRLYTVQVFEYNGNAGAETYFTSTATGNPATQTTLSVLPLTWLDFTANEKQDVVQLNWLTTAETGISGFDICRSADGLNWSVIAHLPVQASTSATHQYSYIDYTRLASDRYYRLIARNEDGRPEYSKIITLRKTGYSYFTVINPVQQHLLQLQLNRPATLKLVGLDGKTVLTLHLDAGSVNTALPEHIRGIYQLTDGKQSIKLLIE